MNPAFQKTERIKSIFIDIQMFYEKHTSIPALIEYLENTEPEFRSVAYESASMAIAVKDFETDQFPANWLLFAEGPALTHKTQIYIGLGWAIAKLNLPFLTAVKDLDPEFHFSIAEGCGYYDGSFRYRQTVINMQLPVYLPTSALLIYDQGVGRSIWYNAKADIHKADSLVESFPAGRQAGLWRGIGIAVAYAGGCNDEDLRTLLDYAATNRFQLAYGARLAARSRLMANSMTTDTDRCSRLWFALSVDTPAIANEDAYCNWIKQMEETLSDSFEKRS
jgi:enediyne biosynthesis protein E3